MSRISSSIHAKGRRGFGSFHGRALTSADGALPAHCNAAGAATPLALSTARLLARRAEGKRAPQDACPSTSLGCHASPPGLPRIRALGHNASQHLQAWGR